MLILKVIFKGEDKWLFLINQPAEPTVSMKMGIFLKTLVTDNPSSRQTRIKGTLLICFSIKTTNLFSVHKWINHLLYWIKCPFFLLWTLFHFLVALLKRQSLEEVESRKLKIKNFLNSHLNQYSERQTLDL